ncbi:MAG: 2-oxo acid dehydrogenase subunit E2 [Candidatus Eisenbacteria bacterium]|uniref:Dihydrolipoamide acetyltransferase component of pyruvate dehydrogenase complex n=1 Tax=Eiseniibacteriota bacterium TaxID=2212470 RepID=A0A948S1R2_UNCEI|nr:2-oxo acid dehydrogenase subunit E2 [Candidatus Eisenbacteria bacterium]MBU1948346.1 2-oxo acid dehydrogenase subunit E2 [Candidatus Eisenbacteria bacterium]MBU2692239.1 2-oxo acid dehydrogenase subunit E2 [Candidatus Eisenbacteria bacterium]
MYEFKLPDLGEGIQEGEILKWYIAAGDKINEDDPLVDVETDKAAVTIPSPKGGTIARLSGDVGGIINVGDVIVVIDDGTGGTVAVDDKGVAEKESVAPAAQAPAAPAAPAAPVAAVMSAGPVAAAPATRRLARELGVDIRTVPATGPAGRVTGEDVKRFHGTGGAAAPEKRVCPLDIVASPETEFAARAASAIPYLDIEPLPDFSQWGLIEIEKLRSIRRKVARKMITSFSLIPHVAHMDEADVTDLEAFRKRENERRKGKPGGHLTLLSFVIKAVTAGLRAAPSFNASLDHFKDQIIYKKYYNIGIAVDTGRGLIVPVIRETDRKSIIEVSAEIERLAAAARDGKIAVQDLQGGTFTITNVGPMGGTALLPTINYPEVAILAMGAAQDKAVVRDGQIVIRKMLPLTLAFDHRITDGADAARFVSEMVRTLSDPNLLLLET